MIIYKLSWYDEDCYGPMYGMYVIVQAETVPQAKEQADNYLRSMYNTSVDDLEKQYEKFDMEDLSSATIVASGSVGI